MNKEIDMEKPSLADKMTAILDHLIDEGEGKAENIQLAFMHGQMIVGTLDKGPAPGSYRLRTEMANEQRQIIKVEMFFPSETILVASRADVSKLEIVRNGPIITPR